MRAPTVAIFEVHWVIDDPMVATTVGDLITRTRFLAHPVVEAMTIGRRVGPENVLMSDDADRGRGN